MFFLSLLPVVLGNAWNSKGNIDRALLILNGTEFSSRLILWQNSRQCDKCSWIRSRDRNGSILPRLAPNQTAYAWIDTRWPQRFRLTDEKYNNSNFEDEGVGATPFRQLHELGNYTLNLSNSSTISNIIPLANDSPDYTPLWTTVLALLIAQIVYSVAIYYWKNRGEAVSEDEEPILEGNSVPPPQKQEKKRLRSLDTFRGFCLMLMIFVNYGGGQYWFFHHAPWHGLTVADLVMPWFMFLMGVSLTLSLNSMIRRGASKWAVLCKISVRATKLLVLGLFVINHDSDWRTMRIPGVLQRFFICYVVVGGLHAFLTPQGATQGTWGDLLPFWPQWIVIGSLQALWISLTFLVPLAGCPRGYLGPGGLHENSAYKNCTGGAAALIDQAVFGKRHMYPRPSCRQVYFHDEFYFANQNVYHDPEGLLGSLNSVLVVFLGLQAGKILTYHKTSKARCVRFLAWGFALCCVGGALCGFSQNDGLIPVNKNLWTTSYVLVLGGGAFVVLLVFYLLVDEWEMWDGAPFYFVGMNSILLYILHELLKGRLPFFWKIYGEKTHEIFFLQNVVAVAIWTIFAFFCFKAELFLVL